MKTRLLTGIFVLWGAFCLAQIPAPEGGFPLSFPHTLYDIGIIGETSGKVYHAFSFQNTGKDTLWIESAAASCHCTTGEFPKEAIPPGHRGSIRITYDPKGRPWEFEAAVQVKLKGKTQTQKLVLKGNTKGGTETPRFAPLQFVQRFQYNEKAIAAEEAGFTAFVSGLVPLIEKHRFLDIQIESSASEVPTKTYRDNTELTEVRAQEAQDKILKILESLHADPERIRFRPPVTKVQGPAYSKDYQKQLSKYLPFQYVKVQVF